MASFITIFHLALSAPLYINSGMFIPFKGPPRESRGPEVRGAEPPEFSLVGGGGLKRYRLLAEPEKFYRGLILDRNL
ncbi:hypothetical protein FVE67_01230 [Thermosulfurimonas marina]|uniref:Uncharacterized protein n=1 Tax=Thermosulfurimonas marina TaxID=2047767 RepID=A0A6H1WQK6_9BACT|nr:hypothetical protein [Thermosulfurimonas marina]QJA05497.1 hypothetical protein FVE67_01230 [Thermosulfurimonas marina]